MNTIREEFEKALFDVSSSEDAINMKKYMKDQFEYIGVKTPKRKEVWKPFQKNADGLDKEVLIELIKDLFASPYREVKYSALGLAARHVKKFDVSDLEWIDELAVTDSWWDTIDTLASSIIGEILKGEKEQRQIVLDRYVKKDYLWLNRISILYQLKYKDRTDFEFLAEVINRFNTSKEFFIAKAIGWALREYSKTDANAVIEFVENNELRPLSEREALKWLDRRK